MKPQGLRVFSPPTLGQGAFLGAVTCCPPDGPKYSMTDAPACPEGTVQLPTPDANCPCPPGTDPDNRLLDLPTNLLMRRRQLVYDILFFANATPEGIRKRDQTEQIGTLWPLPGDFEWKDVNCLLDVMDDPKPAEIEDLRMIDSVLPGPMLRNEMYSGCHYPVPPWEDLMAKLLDKDLLLEGGAPLRANPFFCTGGIEPIPPGMPKYYPSINHDQRHYLDLKDITAPWRDMKMKVRNAYVVFKALNGYPFPNPIPILPAAWYANGEVQAGLRSLINEPLPEKEESAVTLVRMWITMITVQTYNWVANAIAEEIESELEHELRRDLVRSAVVAIGIAIVTAGLGAAISLAIPSVTIPGGLTVSTATAVEAFTAAVQSYYTKEEQAKAAEELSKIAAQFRPDNPAFADEVQKVSDTFAFLADKLGTAWGLTQEELDAIEAAKARGEISPATHGTFDTTVQELQKTSPLIPIGVGALTAGALYFLL